MTMQQSSIRTWRSSSALSSSQLRSGVGRDIGPPILIGALSGRRHRAVMLRVDHQAQRRPAALADNRFAAIQASVEMVEAVRALLGLHGLTVDPADLFHAQAGHNT